MRTNRLCNNSLASSIDLSGTLKIDFGLIKSVDPDEMPHNVAFHLGIYCLPKYALI